MTFEDFLTIGQVGLELWLAALAVIVAWGLLTHPERMRGLLTSEAGGGIEPERLQGLLVVLFAAGSYVATCAGVISAPAASHQIPDIPQSVLTVLVGSQVLYLGGKLGRSLQSPEI